MKLVCVGNVIYLTRKEGMNVIAILVMSEYLYDGPLGCYMLSFVLSEVNAMFS
mgnify:CR=1 FL=1